jgi:uncharacterized protein (TIGR03382 family)
VLRLRRLSPVVGFGALAAAIGLAVWPLNAPGVTGSALAPHYREFGWYSYTPLPAQSTADDIRRAGIPVPHDAVQRRQAEAEAAASLAIAGLAFAWLSRRRPR